MPARVGERWYTPYQGRYGRSFRLSRTAPRILWIVLFVCLYPYPTRACDVPVYQWALARWQPDPYRVIVFHQGDLAPSERAAFDKLQAAKDADTAPANVIARNADTASMLEKDLQPIWDAQDSPTLPWMVVRHPIPTPASAAVWAGPFSQQSVDALLDSPKRRDIARRLLDGEAAVWVLLDSSDPTKDDEVAATLADSLKQAQKALIKASVPEALILPGEKPPIRFSMLRVSRTDPAERLFVAMLLAVEPDLHNYTEHPIAFPTFGRGRALYALVGPGITAKNILNACTFLVDGCSCEIKEDNPGMDLLMAADWKTDNDYAMIEEIELPPLPGMAQQVASVVEGRATTPAQPPPTQTASVASDVAVASADPVWRNALIAMAIGVIIVLAASFALVTKRGAPRRK